MGVLVLIIAGAVYALMVDSVPTALIVGSLVIYRAQRPSRFRQRVRDAWYAHQVAQVGEPE